VQTVRLLGRDIPVLQADDGSLRAADNDKPASAKGAQGYVARAFGNRLAEVRAAIEALAASLPPQGLNRGGFRLYQRFRPEVPQGVEGWGQGGIADRANRAGWGIEHEAKILIVLRGTLGRPQA